MNLLEELTCPSCSSSNLSIHTRYTVKSENEERRIYQCNGCAEYFSETKGTPLEGLRTPISRIAQIIQSLNEGQSINAVIRVFHVGRKSIENWLERFGKLKEVLLLYSLCHDFLSQLIEGDELYTKVEKNRPPDQSEGWTIVLMERSSRFLWELQCGEKDESLFKSAIQTLAQVIEKTQDLSLLTDGERRYGNLLFEICRQTLHTGKPGRPRQTLPEGVKVRVKNKGSQDHKKGPKRPKYQAPQPEHPETTQNLDDKEIHANHLEGFNAGLRRKLSCFRRQTNTYAKDVEHLQTRLDVHWIIHNFVQPHATTKIVPAVAIGICKSALSFQRLFRMRYA